MMTLVVHLQPHITNKQRELARSITAREVAGAADLNENTVRAYFKGNITMTKLEVLDKLARYFGVEPGELLKRV